MNEKYLVRRKYGKDSYGHSIHDSIHSIIAIHSKAIENGNVQVFELDTKKLVELELVFKVQPIELRKKI